MKNIGGSILPSSDPRILAPMESTHGTFQVKPDHDKDTHVLTLTQNGEVTILCSHPNGYSCHALAKRILSGDSKRIKEQAEYIIRCGGTAELQLLEAFA